MEDVLKEILSELQAIHSRLDSIDNNIGIYSAGEPASEILNMLRKMKQEK